MKNTCLHLFGTLMVLCLSTVRPQNIVEPRALIPKNECMILRTQNIMKDTTYFSRMQVRDTLIGSIPMYVLRIGKDRKVLFDKDEFRPYKFSVRNGKDGRVKEIRYSSKRAIIKQLNVEKIKTLPIGEDTYDRRTLFYVLRKMGLEKHEKISFSIIVENSTIGFILVKMRAERIGVEEVRVPSGHYLCHKIEVGVAGLIGKLFWPTKYTYYFTKVPPCHFVKYIDPDGESIELFEYTTLNQKLIKSVAH